MSDGIIALILRFRATKKRPIRVIARLYYKDLLFFKRNIKVNRLRTIDEKSPKLQECSFPLSHLSDKTYDQNNENPRREGQKLDP